MPINIPSTNKSASIAINTPKGSTGVVEYLFFSKRCVNHIKNNMSKVPKIKPILMVQRVSCWAILGNNSTATAANTTPETKCCVMLLTRLEGVYTAPMIIKNMRAQEAINAYMVLNQIEISTDLPTYTRSEYIHSKY